MEISAITSDVLSAATAHGLGVSGKLLLPRHHAPALSVSASAAPPATVRSAPFRVSAAPRSFARRTRRRTRRRSSVDPGDEDGGGDDGLSGDDGPFGGGSPGGGGGGGGGGDWGSGDGGEEESSVPSPDPAFDFVYGIMCWLALSNCTHFAAKRIAVFLADKGKALSLRMLPWTC